MSDLLITAPGEGPLWQAGVPIQAKVRGADVADAFCVLELLLPPGGGPPLHVHHREDELFYILEGECTVGTAGHAQRVGPGASIVFPRETPHFFRNDGEAAARILITAVPGGLDRYFEQLAGALAAGQPEQIALINQAYQIEFFG